MNSAEADRIQELKARYESLLHAMQSGVAFKQQRAPGETENKHLRVGVNAAMSDHGALVSLLIEKGVLTEVEYLERLCVFMQREIDVYEAELTRLLGALIKLV
jgi:hypothetical protein